MSEKKYIIVLGDGMADEPIEALSGMTPLAYADTPAMDRLSKLSEIGLVHTIPEGMKPGSDTANLSVLGYDPKLYYSGRSPLEALSIGVPMKDTDVAIRCNIVTISEENVPFEERTIIDHSSGEISTEDCAVLLKAVKAELQNETYQFYVGTSYRHCLIWNKGQVIDLSQPHDVLGQVIGEYLPHDEQLLYMMKRSHEILVNHPINIERKKNGLNPANCCWFWGAGTRPALSSFEEKNGLKGMMVSAVDLLKGIAVGAGMGVAQVEGANGGLHTNYEGKVQAALNALQNGYDFAYIHVEAPDEMGHQGSVEKKVQAIEYLDKRVIGPLVKSLDAEGTNYRLLVMPDHPTPIRVRTHTSDSVPYLLYDSASPKKESHNYNEKEAGESGNFVSQGHTIINKLLER
ncbi:cofactor-independent phosphoglycerate mutase [Parablautia muri]|uniref:Cofactor-independent phosphoglycerate mutase n=1 Tax=Parablautia muri TaxID=2320879 RepID=A0A9X5BFQ2_9FIRM|nr:cofactor-independent phosphoglycerate mutase [Parablautia muri]NBJ92422.1 cofactor-independent phosphoglycerate mutase [Parablautia muri]